MATYTVGRVGIVAKGDYSASTSYSALDMVNYQDSSYIAKQATVGIIPTNATYWMLAARGSYDSALAGGYNGTKAEFYADLATMQSLEAALAAI